MHNLYGGNTKKNFTPLTDTLFSVDKNPELMKKAHTIIKAIIEDGKNKSK